MFDYDNSSVHQPAVRRTEVEPAVLQIQTGIAGSAGSAVGCQSAMAGLIRNHTAPARTDPYRRVDHCEWITAFRHGL